MARTDGRPPDVLRPIRLVPGFVPTADGSVLYEAGQTRVVCTACIQDGVPPWRVGSGEGWITAEYGMLPGSTRPRKPRERAGKVDGRTTEIQRLIGRSLRAVIDLSALGERTIALDCDVIQADGGTRTASITGAFLALADALHARRQDIYPAGNAPIRDTVAAVSVGIVADVPLLDLDYHEDFQAAVDMNVVMTGRGQFVELQGTGEEATFSQQQLAELLHLARQGITQLIDHQRQYLGERWPIAEPSE